MICAVLRLNFFFRLLILKPFCDIASITRVSWICPLFQIFDRPPILRCSDAQTDNNNWAIGTILMMKKTKLFHQTLRVWPGRRTSFRLILKAVYQTRSYKCNTSLGHFLPEKWKIPKQIRNCLLKFCDFDTWKLQNMIKIHIVNDIESSQNWS